MKDTAKCDKVKGTKRSTLACLSCRNVRQKCSGEPPEDLPDQHSIGSTDGPPVKSRRPCKRCVLNHQECLWNQSRRLGRPRNAQKTEGVQESRDLPAYPSCTIPIDSSDSSASLATVSSEISSSLSPTDREVSSQIYGAQNLITDANFINLSDVLSLMQTDVDTLPGYEQGPMIHKPSSSIALGDNTWYPIVNDNPLHIYDDVAPQQTSELISSGEFTQKSLAPLTTSANLPNILISGEGVGEGKRENLEKIIVHGVQRYIDLSLDLPPMTSGGTTQIQRVILEPSEKKSLGEKSLYLAMAAAGYRMSAEDFTLADGLFDNSFTHLQQFLSNSGVDHLDIIGAVDAMHAIQACSVLVPYAYGTHDVPKAEKLLLGAAQLAIRHGLHRLDSPEFSNDRISFRVRAIELKNRLGEQIGCTCHQFETCAACFLEALRQTWWELYVCNTIFWSSTSKAGPNSGSILNLQSSINAPKGLDLKNDLASGIWQLRIRCAAILIESLSVERMEGAAAKARLQALDTMITNLQKALHGSDLSLTVKNENVNRTRLHLMITVCRFMLYGGQIHLHRLRWVPSFSLKLRVCSFKDLNKVEGSEENLDEVWRTSERQSFIHELENEAEYELARHSLTTILSCANKILELIPNAAEEGCEKAGPTFNTLNADLPITTFYRWPFFACVEVVAAFGQLIGLTAHRRSASCQSSALHISESTVGLCLDSQCTFQELIAFPHIGEDKVLPAKWLRLKACSNLQLAENMLSCMELTWPFAENCRHEVEACRTTIQGIGGITGLEYSL